MKTFRPTFVLIGLFFAGLLVLWWLDDSGVPTEAERRGRLNRVLPDLIDTPEAAITRLEILRGGETLAFERRGRDRWQMTRPLDVAADATVVETLVGNLKNLRKSPESGTITGPPENYGLAPPESVVRLWGEAGGAARSQTRLLAALEIGKTVRDLSYVRQADAAGIEVVDKKLLSATGRPLTEWRQMNLIPVPTFQISSLTVQRDALNLKAERGAGGQWRLTAPVKAPANGAKIESTLAALSSIRVLDGEKGFSADNVTDFAPFGLDKPEATIELTTTTEPDSPLVLHVGKKVPDHPDRVYVRRGDQDDVASVSDRFLAEIPRDSVAYRSQHITNIDPGAVSEIEISALSTTFRLEREGTGWLLKSPRVERADSYLVQSLVNQLDSLQASEFLNPARVIRPDLDPPIMTLKIWQSASTGPPSRAKRAEIAEAASRTLALTLLIGRHDRLKKTIYSRLEGDSVVLALPDSLLEVLPRNHLAYRDRGVLSVNPASVSKLTLVREGTTTVLEPDRSSGAPNRWRMVAPVRAPADVEAVTHLLALLADLRAEDFAAEAAGDGKNFGLDQPPLVVAWDAETAPGGPPARPEPPSQPAAAPSSSGGRLRIGKPVPGKPGTFYAAVEAQPFVFTLGAPAVQALLAEYHQTLVLSFQADAIRRLVFRLPERTLAFSHNPRPGGGPANWRPEPGTDASGIDLSRFDDLVKQLAQLRTSRFLQYQGPIPAATGLSRPKLVLELDTGPGNAPQVLRIGETQGGLVAAASGASDTGPVFLLPSAAWNALIPSAGLAAEIPANPFAP
jgi:Domain of unknown function (DUF4340)